jgi:hypothetical protein
MKNFKLSEENELLFAFIGIILLLIFFSSCNPVKKVLKDPTRFGIIKDTVIKRGYCKCDTLYSFKSDTLEIHDTTTFVYVDTTIINDTTYLWETKYHTITKVRTIRDSVKMVVVDSAMLGVLRKELSIEKNKNKENMHWRKMFSLILVASFLFFILLFKLK